jgi:hypothetical protein
MLLADYVHRDPATGKCSILGTFGALYSPIFPAPLALTVYFALTDGRGEHDSRLVIVDANEIASDQAQPVVDIRGKFRFDDPLAVLEASLLLRADIPTPSVYHIELYVNDTLLMSRKLLAIQLEPEGK